MAKTEKVIKTYTINSDTIEILKNLNESIGINEGRIISNVITFLDKLGILEIVVLSRGNSELTRKMICEKICTNNQTSITSIEASKNEKKEGEDEREGEKTDEKKETKTMNFKYKI
jgi:hypothetical protein